MAKNVENGQTYAILWCFIIVTCMVINVQAHHDKQYNFFDKTNWFKAVNHLKSFANDLSLQMTKLSLKFESHLKNALCKVSGHLPLFVKKIFPELCHLQTDVTVHTGRVDDLKERIMQYEDTIFNQRCVLLVMDLKETGIVPWDKKTNQLVDIIKHWYKTFILRFIDLQKDLERNETQILHDLTKFIEDERVFENLVFTLKDQGLIEHKTPLFDSIDVIENWFEYYHSDNKYKEQVA